MPTSPVPGKRNNHDDGVGGGGGVSNGLEGDGDMEMVRAVVDFEDEQIIDRHCPAVTEVNDGHGLDLSPSSPHRFLLNNQDCVPDVQTANPCLVLNSINCDMVS